MATPTVKKRSTLLLGKQVLRNAGAGHKMKGGDDDSGSKQTPPLPTQSELESRIANDILNMYIAYFTYARDNTDDDELKNIATKALESIGTTSSSGLMIYRAVLPNPWVNNMALAIFKDYEDEVHKRGIALNRNAYDGFSGGGKKVSQRKMHIGPQGGKYYIKNGRKVYC